MKPRRLAQLRRRLRPVAESLALDGADVESFRALLEHFRQRPVQVLPCPLGPEVLGVWLETKTSDYILYKEDATAYHRRHIILHEGSHMLAGHTGPAAPEFAYPLAPHLDRALVERLMCHTVFDEDEEAEAEVLATLIEEQMDRTAPPRIRNAGEANLGRIQMFLRETR